MRGLHPRINIVLAILLLVGCESPSGSAKKKGKPLKNVRIHVESRHDIAERSIPVVVGRSSPMRYSAEKLPILSEMHVERATLLDDPGGFRLELKFDTLGARILESYTSAAAGRHLCVMIDVDGETRWIAAPMIRQRISNGTLSFVPDASRDEMDRLVLGLNKEVRNRKNRLLD